MEGRVMKLCKLFLSAIAIAIATPATALAQTAADRAGELKLWRDKCSEPDTDSRMAYIEDAIASNDIAAIRICTRLALSSNDADIRNTGLRAAIAAAGRITFDVEYPPFLKKAYEKAGDDEAKRREVRNYYIARDFPQIENGLIFEIQNATATSSSSVWYAMVSRSEPNNNYKGPATIRGDKLTWSGNAFNGKIHCTLSTKLFPGNILKGKFQCGNRGSYKISVNLL